MATIETRRATPADRAALEHLLHEHLAGFKDLVGPPPPHIAPRVAAELADPVGWLEARGGLWLVARTPHLTLGMVGLAPLDGAEGELRRMYVRPAARELGVGRALLDAALTTAGELGYRRLFLETSPRHMAAAYRLYRAYGARTVPARKLRGVLDAVGMELTPAAARTLRAA